jgi:hypothetical protein
MREAMTWKCEPGRVAQDPTLQGVAFSFVKNPELGVLLAAPGLCTQLQAIGKPTVTIDYDVWGNPVEGLTGYQAKRIEGQAFHDVFATHTADSLEPNPLAKPFEQP